jgi:hypothetical protein
VYARLADLTVRYSRADETCGMLRVKNAMDSADPGISPPEFHRLNVPELEWGASISSMIRVPNADIFFDQGVVTNWNRNL